MSGVHASMLLRAGVLGAGVAVATVPHQAPAQQMDHSKMHHPPAATEPAPPKPKPKAKKKAPAAPVAGLVGLAWMTTDRVPASGMNLTVALESPAPVESAVKSKCSAAMSATSPRTVAIASGSVAASSRRSCIRR